MEFALLNAMQIVNSFIILKFLNYVSNVCNNKDVNLILIKDIYFYKHSDNWNGNLLISWWILNIIEKKLDLFQW